MRAMTTRSSERRAVDGLVLLDKPQGLSSNAALQKVKRLFHAEKAGHTGSLDPLASGLLPICLGQATKLSGLLLDADKRYRARAKLGERTNTGDTEGQVIERRAGPWPTAAQFEAAGAGLRGSIAQTPPMYSALKREGRPLYELARAGLEVERAVRTVQIRELRLLEFSGDAFEFEVLCSKGTYVRTLAEDWAAAAGQLAHLVALRRLEAGPFKAQDMLTLDALEQAAQAGCLHDTLRPLSLALPDWPRIVVSEQQALRLSHGQMIDLHCEAAAGALAIFGADGSVLGLAEYDGAGHVAPRRWLSPLPLEFRL